MTFESMHEVLATVRTYGDRVASLYGLQAQRATDPYVKFLLERGIWQERRLQRGVLEYEQRTSAAVESTWFKWHDRRQLFRALDGLDHARIDSMDEALDLMQRCDEALVGYYSALRASTNSAEVLELLGALREMRQRVSRDRAWQAQRAEA